jgi:hypothetical protein
MMGLFLMTISSRLKLRLVLIAGILLLALIVAGVILKIRHDLGESVGKGGYDLIIFALKRADIR